MFPEKGDALWPWKPFLTQQRSTHYGKHQSAAVTPIIKRLRSQYFEKHKFLWEIAMFCILAFYPFQLYEVNQEISLIHTSMYTA